MNVAAILAALCGLTVALHGATARAGARLDPADPTVPAPALRYQSAFEGYQRFQAPKPVSWRDANDQVGRLGGHAGHADPGSPKHRPDHPPAPPAPASPAGETAPAPAGQGSDHGKHR